MHNTQDDSGRRNAKIAFLTILIFVIMILYAMNLFSMQILNGDYWKQRAVKMTSVPTILDAQRGEIFDRNADNPIVVNTDSFVVELIPGDIPDGQYDTVATKLAEYLGITKDAIDKKTSGKRKAFTSIEIKINVPLEVISNIAENITDFPGVSWRNKPIRTYLETGSISHVLGYVGNITMEELKLMLNEGYNRNYVVGKTGIEKLYDQLLQGTPGSETRLRDAKGRYIDEAPVVVPPQMGKNLVLTIDTRIQKLAEKALGERVGASIVLKPSNGEILAMVSYPYFESNAFSTENASAEFSRLTNTPNNPLLNRAVNAAYPPASTFKTIMTTAVLSEKAFPPDKAVECSGRLFHGDRLFKCHRPPPGHGWLNLKNALAQSCDIYYWVIGRDYLGVDRIASYATEFGFGQSLEIDLPSQTKGFVPTAQWMEREKNRKWTDGDTMNISIGQGDILATPLHVANMMAMVCNSGKIYKPHLLKEVRDPATNEVLQTVEPEVLHESTVDASVWRTVQTYLRYMITDGTAIYPMHNKVVQIAGKTGTAEVGFKDRWHSWMVAYAPYDAPVEDQVVVVTLVEAVNDWEWWAPYATNIIMQGIFANQTYEESIKTLGFEDRKKQVGRQD
ncbi:MAG: penicillin-binding protein 2 [Treponema sp.]|nr:penicillin-binding protein 2 [Treponema sp.]